MAIQFTQEQLLELKEVHYWQDEDLERFKDFLETYPEFIPDDWLLEDVAAAVAMFESADQAFWFIEEGNEFSGIAELLASYDLSNLKEGQTTLAQHLVEEHNHYYKVKNGYVFFAE